MKYFPRYGSGRGQMRFRDLTVLRPSLASEAEGVRGGLVNVRASAKPDRLICGDGLAVMAELAGASFDAIYFDPPFLTHKVRQGDRGAFADDWPSLDAYLDWFKPWVVEAHRLLKPTGWLWLHLDWHAAAYVRVMTDAIFGPRQFKNEIVWHYTGRRSPADHRFNQKHDNLLLYARSPQSRLAPLFEPWTRDEYVAMKRQRVHRDETGREWIWGHAGRGRSKAYRIYLDEQVERGRAVDSVWDIPIINTSAGERTGYPTQKPQALLMRVVQSSVPEGGLIGDFMAGSGTTAVVAFKLGRRFVAADREEAAVLVAEERLLECGATVTVERRPPDAAR